MASEQMDHLSVNRLTAVDAYMRKSEGPSQKNHKKSTVHYKIPKIC